MDEDVYCISFHGNLYIDDKTREKSLFWHHHQLSSVFHISEVQHPCGDGFFIPFFFDLRHGHPSECNSLLKTTKNFSLLMYSNK
jgi:hypothetical protein